MVIRKAQVGSLDADVAARFELEMFDHLQSFAPKHCEIIHDEGVRRVVQLGFDSAKRYGFTMRGPVRYFIELMFMFGSYFDTDVQYPWAAEALNDPLTATEMFRAEALHRNMTEYLQHVSGPENAFAKSALRATPRLAAEPLAAGEDLRTVLIARMHQVYPEKCAWLGSQLLSNVLDGGLTAARKKGRIFGSG